MTQMSADKNPEKNLRQSAPSADRDFDVPGRLEARVKTFCSIPNILSFLKDYITEVWDYVIAHELLHFFVPNHGKLWKSLMRLHLGDYGQVESKLREGSSTASRAGNVATMR